MPEMTIIEALTICRDMWSWLAEHPEADKGDYLRAHPHVPQTMEADCSCCQYCQEQGHKFECSACPLLDFFRKGLSEDDVRYDESPCIGTVYGTWLKSAWHRDNDRDLRVSSARAIANAAQAELDKMSCSQ